MLKLFYSDNENYERIYKEKYNSSYAFHLDFEINNNPAFFMREPSLSNKLVKIYKLDKRVCILRSELPGKAIEQFAKRCLVDEIVQTNGIEGVYSSRKEINETLNELEKKSSGKRFMGLVQKYLLLQHGSDIPLKTCEDIRYLYDSLVYSEIEEDSADNLPDGKIFRKDSTSVLSATQREIHRGVYPESKIIESMEKALDILYDQNIDFVYRVAIFHYLFGYIHPFYDGNGRTSRFISSYLLSTEFESIIGYRLSVTIQENLKSYYEAFKICNDPHNKGDLTPFIDMFTDIILISMQQLISALEKRLHKLNYYHKILIKLPYGTDKKFETLYSLLIQASLFSENGITTQELIDILGCSRTTLSNRLKKLSESELLITKVLGHVHSYCLNLNKADEITS